MRTTLDPALIVLLTILCPCYQRAIIPQTNTMQLEHKPGLKVNKTGYLITRTTALPDNTAPTAGNGNGSGEDTERTGTTSSDESAGSDSGTETTGENHENGDEESFSSHASTTKSPQTNEHSTISPVSTTSESNSSSTTAESTTVTNTTMIAAETSTSPSTVVTPETATTSSTEDSSSSSTTATIQTTTPASTPSSKTSEPASLPGSGDVVTGSPTTTTGSTMEDDVMTPTTRALASKSEEEDSPLIGAIAGGIGGCVLFALVIGLVVFFVLKKKKDKKKEKTANSAQSLSMTGPTGPVPPPAATKPAFARVAKKKRPRQVQPVIVDEKHHTFMGPLTIDAGPKGPLKHGMEGVKSESIKGDLVFDDAGNKVWDIGSDVEILEKKDGESMILVDDDNTLVGSQLLQSPGSKEVDQQPKPGPTPSLVPKKS